MKPLQENNAIIAGGVFASIFTETPISDIDVFFPSLEKANNFLRRVNAPPYRGRDKCNVNLGQFQIIRFHTAETPEKLFETFDILAAQIAYNCATNSFHSADGAIDDLINKQIRVIRRTNTLEICLKRIVKWRASKQMVIHPDTWKLIEETCNQPDTQFNTLFADYTQNATEPVLMMDNPRQVFAVPPPVINNVQFVEGVRGIFNGNQVEMAW